MTDLTHLSTYLPTLIGILFGAASTYGVINRASVSQRREDSTVATNLISNLQTTATLQEKEIEQLRKDKIEQGQQIAHLQGQIKTFTEIFQGRDPAMQAFLAANPLERMDKLTAAVENLVKLLTPKT